MTTSTTRPRPQSAASTTVDPDSVARCPDEHIDVLEYYTEAGPDYAAWSPSLHMHFGYFRSGLGPFDRDRMLQEMSHQVLARLGLTAGEPARIVDLGCGFAATARLAARSRPEVSVDAVTIVPSQVSDARNLTREAGLERQVSIHRADYTATGFTAGAYDAAFAIESTCHDQGADKRGVLEEAARLLAPGATLVVADGFLRRPDPLGPVLGACCRAICADWAVTEFARLPDFLAAAEEAGFEIQAVEDISWRSPRPQRTFHG